MGNALGYEGGYTALTLNPGAGNVLFNQTVTFGASPSASGTTNEILDDSTIR